jgi:hypothetical protein
MAGSLTFWLPPQNEEIGKLKPNDEEIKEDRIRRRKKKSVVYSDQISVRSVKVCFSNQLS